MAHTRRSYVHGVLFFALLGVSVVVMLTAIQRETLPTAAIQFGIGFVIAPLDLFFFMLHILRENGH